MIRKILYSTLLLQFVFLSVVHAETFIFPPGFHKGVGLSAFQNGGLRFGYSNWSWFEEKKHIINAKTFFGPPIKNNEKIGKASHFWENALNDVDLLVQLGCNSFRFSIEWAEVEPVAGEFNEGVLDFYEALIDKLISNNITPMITLYHFVHPYWFERLGGFEKEENISLFVRYCTKVFSRFGSKVPFWCTINEPTVSAACGYVLGIHPPGKCFQFKTAGMVLNNLLNAHIATYQTLKPMDGGEQAQIGIVHQMLEAEAFDPSQASYWPIGLAQKYSALPLVKFLNVSFAHKATKEFLKTGTFHYRIPGLVNITTHNPDAPDSYDFIGLNFYSKVILGPHPTHYPDQTMTDMEYASRPDTMYNAIAEMSELGKPIYITENGIADAKDVNRAQFITSYLKQVHRALLDGFDVRGYYYWTLMDNFEWNDGFDMKFGLFEVDYATQIRTLRQGALPFKDQFVIEAAAAA